MSDAGSRDAERVRLLRETLTATRAGIYLATHLAGPLPAETMAAVHESDEMELRIGRVGPDRVADLALREQEARAGLAAVLAAPLERVVLAHSAAAVAAALSLAWLAGRPVDRRTVVLVEGLAEPVRRAVVAAAGIVGAEAHAVDAPPHILSAAVAAVVMPHLDGSGRLLDPVPVRTAARRVGARLLLDASLTVGALPLRASSLGADALVAEVRHWLLGPEGVAFAWLAEDEGEAMPAGVAAPAGSFGRASLLAAARSVGWLLMFAELPWVVARTTWLAAWLHDRLASIPGVEVLSPAGGHGPLLALRIAGWEGVEAADELSSSVFAITDPEPEGGVLRISVGAWNTEEELERFAARVAELAASTPATVRRRPALTILAMTPEDGGA